jgi:hypothetical protein
MRAEIAFEGMSNWENCLVGTHRTLYFLARSILEAARGAASVFGGGGGSNARHALAYSSHVHLLYAGINPIYGFHINNLSYRSQHQH